MLSIQLLVCQPIEFDMYNDFHIITFIFVYFLIWLDSSRTFCVCLEDFFR